ncbi:MAG: 4-hydroxy-tetrahydrodipicolinate synthase [Candidatus Eisenbacteria bacterium]
MFRGLFVAMVTPFKGGAVDREAVTALTKTLVDAGCDGLVPCGCTGEAATLTPDERREVIRLVVERAKGKCSVVAGTGTNNTLESITHSKAAEELGADGVMLITPYYNKPGPEGQYEHFRAVAASVKIPVVLYNVPGRTGVNMLPETVWKLAELSNVVAIKEASGSLDQASLILSKWEGGSSAPFTLLSGDDSLALPMLAVGASGVISVAANVVPEMLKRMLDLFFAGDTEGAKRIHFQLLPLFKALFLEANPSPIKKACELMGLFSGELRLPLVPVRRETEEALKRELKKLGKV